MKANGGVSVMGKDENKNTPRQAVGCGRRHNIIRGLESALSTAIEKGMSAVTLSKRVSKYLRDFDSLKKDYKKRFGTATDIHDCEYRSARLARSEINMAYRNAEQLRWQQMDFILGSL